jgi:hypothetical protein
MRTKITRIILLFIFLSAGLKAERIYFNDIVSVSASFISLDCKDKSICSCEKHKNSIDSKEVVKMKINNSDRLRRLLMLVNTSKSETNTPCFYKIKLEFKTTDNDSHYLFVSDDSIFFDNEKLSFTCMLFNEILKLCEYDKYFSEWKCKNSYTNK